MCYVCEFVRAGNVTVGNAVRDYSGSQNYRCRLSDMSEITPTRCQVDEVCYSMKVDVSGVDGKFTTHTYTHSADTERRPYTGLMLGHRLRYHPNTLCQMGVACSKHIFQWFYFSSLQ